MICVPVKIGTRQSEAKKASYHFHRMKGFIDGQAERMKMDGVIIKWSDSELKWNTGVI